MNDEARKLADYLVHKLDHTPSPQRVLVGVAGFPASGKSTFVHILTEHINRILSQRGSSDSAILVGLDGWHLTRAQLDLFPDPKLAHDRRGIHWTFDAPGYVGFVERLRDGGKDVELILAPSFDHALKDPTPDSVVVHPYHRIVIIEGLYTFLAIEPWSKAGLLLDERWFIHIDPAEATKRLVTRHVLTGVAKDAKEARWRAEENDIPNGHFITANMLEPTRTIHSKDDSLYHTQIPIAASSPD